MYKWDRNVVPWPTRQRRVRVGSGRVRLESGAFAVLFFSWSRSHAARVSVPCDDCGGIQALRKGGGSGTRRVA